MTQLKDSVLCILLCVLISFCGYAQQYHFAVEHITKADGLSNTEITSIVQDKQGFIWIGTRYGLNKFDGYSVKVYQTVPGNTSSLCDNNITALLADSRGDLWIGTENNGISVYDRSVDKFINYEFVESDINSLSANYVTSIKEDSKGNIWVGTLMGLNKFRPNTKDFARYLRMVDVEIDDSSLGKLKAQKFSSSLNQYFQQNMWMKKEYHEMANEVSTMVSKSALESVMEKILQSCRIENRGVDIKAMDIDELDNIWFGFENDSIGKFNPARGALSVFPINPTNKAQHISLLSLCWDSGQLWIGTRDWGLMRFNPQSKTFQIIHSLNW
jgi:ligand-binding sensor domain-containing protein